MSDTANNKRIIRNALFLYVRMIISMLITLYTSRVILNTLGVEDFGIYNVVGGVISMFTLLGIGTAAATQRYLNFHLINNNPQELRKIFSTSLNVHFILSIIILLLGETVGLWFVKTQLVIPADRMEAALWVYHATVLSSMILILTTPYHAAIIAYEKMEAFAYISVLESVLKLLIVFLLLFSTYDKLKFYAVLMLLVQVFIRSIYGIYCSRKFKEIAYQFSWDSALFKEMFSFALWTTNGNLAVFGYTQGLNMLLNIFFGPIINAARGISVQVQSAVSTIASNIQQAINPQITKSYASKDIEYMHGLIFSSSKYSYFLLFLITLPIFIHVDTILYWWLKTVPEHTALFVRLILIIGLLDAFSNPIVVSAQATGRIKKFQLIEGSLLLLILPVSYFALKIKALPELVYVVHFSIAILTQYVRLRIVCPMIHLPLSKYVLNVVVPVCKVSMLSFILPVLLYLFLPKGGWNFILVCSACVGCTVLSIYFAGISVSERELFVRGVKTVVRKFTHKDQNNHVS